MYVYANLLQIYRSTHVYHIHSICVFTLDVYPLQMRITCRLHTSVSTQTRANRLYVWIHTHRVYIEYKCGVDTHAERICMWIHMKSLPSGDTHEELTLWVATYPLCVYRVARIHRIP